MSSVVCVLKGVPIITTGSLKSRKNGNPGMPIFTGCVYFHDTPLARNAMTGHPRGGGPDMAADIRSGGTGFEGGPVLKGDRCHENIHTP